MPVKPPSNSDNYLGLSRLPTLHTQILTPGHAADNSKSSLHQGRLLTISMLPYAAAVSQQFQRFLFPVQAFDASHPNPYTCTGSQHFRQFLMPGKPPDNYRNSLHN
ncbi:hypothetical protein O181_051363 [Austropuccinia psidii MF-1]|uniref:Uncharacterized protein n=1 Tax=Austropuccinia psidii MF-1 TaxID=1389203 RepID=A0A9Q3E3I6_9BASI|nr:hypothetical protein [Austropuccinia psidii MF-1]